MTVMTATGAPTVTASAAPAAAPAPVVRQDAAAGPRRTLTPAMLAVVAVLVAVLAAVAIALSMRHGGPAHNAAFLYNG